MEIGRQHARNFDAGHFASGGAARRVLTELRELAKHMASPATEAATLVCSGLTISALAVLVGSQASRWRP